MHRENSKNDIENISLAGVYECCIIQLPQPRITTILTPAITDGFPFPFHNALHGVKFLCLLSIE